MAHKTVATIQGGDNEDLTASEISAINSARNQSNQKTQANAWRLERQEAYIAEVGDAYDQIDYICQNGVEALALKRQDIKNRFPNPNGNGNDNGQPESK